MKITKETVANAIGAFERNSNASEKIIFDEKLTGFALRLRRSGRHTWIFQYRTPTQQRRLTLGLVSGLSVDKARKEAERKYGEVKTDGDPQQKKELERERAKRTLATVIADFLESKKTKLRPNSYAELARYLNQHWAPFHKVPIAKIDKDALDTRLKATVKSNGPTSAARGRIALSSLFMWAMRKGLCAANPVLGTDDPDENAAPRERILSEGELKAVWDAAADADDDTPNEYGRVLRLLILTGQRRQEIGSMTWDELSDGKLSIPGYRTKNGRPHQIPLPAAALEIIKSVPRRHGTPFLFGKDHGFVSWSMHKEAFDERCGVKDWTVHDLRRTAASGMQRLGIRVEVIEKALNHVSGSYRGVAGIYQRDLMTEPVLEALEKWSAEVRRIVTTKKIPKREPVPAA